ncbi:MAG: PAS domain-containing protein [Betaproteobacteria bacterium]|nr:PAS domain-containing protein [Betaproteobacteria bacterium]
MPFHASSDTRRTDALAAYRAALDALRSPVGNRARWPAPSDRAPASDGPTGAPDSMRDVIYSLTPDGGEVLCASPSADHLFVMLPQDVTGRPREWFLRIHEADRDAVRQRLPALFREGCCEVEYRIALRSGGVRWLRDRMSMVRDGAGRAVRIDGIATDITRQVLAERAPRRDDRESGSTPNGMVVTDKTSPSHPVADADRAFRQIAGYRAGRIPGTTRGFLHRDDSDRTGLGVLRAAISEEPAHAAHTDRPDSAPALPQNGFPSSDRDGRGACAKLDTTAVRAGNVERGHDRVPTGPYRTTQDLRRLLAGCDAAPGALARAPHETLLELALVAEHKDGGTGAHTVRPGRLSELVATPRGLDARLTRPALPVHDARKTGTVGRVPAEPGPPDAREREAAHGRARTDGLFGARATDRE